MSKNIGLLEKVMSFSEEKLQEIPETRERGIMICDILSEQNRQVCFFLWTFFLQQICSDIFVRCQKTSDSWKKCCHSPKKNCRRFQSLELNIITCKSQHIFKIFTITRDLDWQVWNLVPQLGLNWCWRLKNLGKSWDTASRVLQLSYPHSNDNVYTLEWWLILDRSSVR